MKVGILGLGLIGGSLARAYALEGHTVYAIQRNESMLSFAMLSGAVHGRLDETTIPACDLILLAIYPGGCADWLEKNAPLVSKDALVIDCCGIKREVCSRCFPLAERYGFTFVGGHPMAGSQFSGFKYSRANLFAGAPMVLVPPVFDDIQLLDRVKTALKPCHFGFFSVTTAEEHDKMIALTSQLAHVTANAYVTSPLASDCKGFTGGSFQDMSRVAPVDEKMWAELFCLNSEFLTAELERLTDRLALFRDAVARMDEEAICALMREGKARYQEFFQGK